MSLENDLKQIGLEEKEAKVYLAALELGPTNIQNLTKKSEIKRSTVYEMIRNLKLMGLILETTKGKRRLFIASEPENLKRSIKSKERILNNILPELIAISNVGFIKPKITFYEGKDGLREIYHNTLKIKGNVVLWVSSTQNIAETVGKEFLEKYIEKRTKKGIRTKSLHITSKGMYDYKYLNPATYKETLREVRFAPPEIVFPNTIAIYDNSVSIINSKKESFGFIIESADYAQSMKVFYDLLWNISKPYGDMNFDNKNKSVENNDTEEKEDDYWNVK